MKLQSGLIGEQALNHYRADGFDGARQQALPRISAMQMVVRSVQLNDKCVEARRDWISRVFEAVESFSYRDQDTHYFSSAERDFDVFLVHGDDAERIRQLFLANEMVLRRKLKICVMASSNARSRATVLKSGCDDVFDITRVNPQEAIARMHGMFARYEASLGSCDLLKCQENLARILFGGRKLTQKSQALFFVLMKNYGKKLKFYNIKVNSGIADIPMTDSRIQALAKYLSKQIGCGFKIEMVSDSECRLVLDQAKISAFSLGLEAQIRAIRYV